MIDNFDSFVHIIVSYLRELGAEVIVERANARRVQITDVDAVVISPGPGTPGQAHASVAAIRECLRTSTPVLGVCLGHQVLAEVCGAKVTRAERLCHGEVDTVTHNGSGVFAGLASPLAVGRYHSLAVAPESIRAPLTITARASDGTVMGIRHTHYPAEGVQFHPESILTPDGKQMLTTWLQGVRAHLAR
ncbi:MAG: aminodeoxychorismate/anthranilate synthase component II [Bowdeniella nasicola]|nr:aminodeoxychorismate/anthranilate synthase component II [Bowdeniella nasicola]